MSALPQQDALRLAAVAAQLASDGAGVALEDDYDAIQRSYLEHGWSDGLPIVPPTAERIAADCTAHDPEWTYTVKQFGKYFAVEVSDQDGLIGYL